jgi:hypothetical protein
MRDGRFDAVLYALLSCGGALSVRRHCICMVLLLARYCCAKLAAGLGQRMPHGLHSLVCLGVRSNCGRALMCVLAENV